MKSWPKEQRVYKLPDVPDRRARDRDPHPYVPHPYPPYNRAWSNQMTDAEIAADCGYGLPPSNVVQLKDHVYNMDPSKGGIKHDAGKNQLELICPYAIEELGQVLTFGAQKYSGWNWAKGMSYARLIGAALRHLFAYARGEDLDPETGLCHVAHAMCCCMFILGLRKRRPGKDDDRHEQEAA